MKRYTMKKAKMRQIAPGIKAWSSGIRANPDGLEDQLLAVLEVRARHEANDPEVQRKIKLHDEWVERSMAAHGRKQQRKRRRQA
jgi:hypothetical protein